MSIESKYVKVIETTVRGTALRFAGYTRALELCARMNREIEVIDFIDSIDKGDVLYDLGACEGRFAIYAALKGLRVFAFEPEQENFDAMAENIALNDECHENLTALKLAVGAYSHEAEINIAQPWAGGHQRVISDAPSRVDLKFDFVSLQKVQVVSLDEYIASSDIPRPNYIKVDVDGSEMPFMEGAKETLKHPALKKVLIELFKGDPSYAEVTQLLKKLHFDQTSEHEVEPGLFNILFCKV
jgi:FkbM family methyltransferase